MSDAAIRRPSIGPWQAIAAFIFLWIAALAIGPVVRAMIQPHGGFSDPRDIVAFRLATGAPFSWLALGGTLLILRLRGKRLGDIGWGRPASIWGWIGAAAVVSFFLISSFRGPACHGLCFIDPKAWLSDWSLFRTATSLAAGITAGICEETAFRGFVMSETRDGGAPLPVQVLMAGALFGLAHAGIAGLSGRFDPTAAISIVASTTVFGVLFAIVYLLGRRSLTPVIVAHGIFAFTTEPWMLLWGLAKTMHGH